MTRHTDLHDMLTGIRNAEGDTTIDRLRPEDAARLAEYHAPREPMTRGDLLMWAVLICASWGIIGAIIWGILG